MKRLNLWLLVAVAALLNACQSFDELENVDNADYDAEYAVPLLNTELSLKEALENFQDLAVITIDPDGLIHFTYSGDVLTQNSDTIFEKINESLSGIPIPITAKRMALPLALPDGFDFDRLVFKAGEFVYGFQHAHPDPVTFTMTLPQVTKNGVPLSFTANLPGYSGSGQLPVYSNLFFPFQLEGYEASPDPVTDSVYVEYELLRSNGQPDTAQVAITFRDLSFSYMEGFLGVQRHEGGRDTIIIDFFDNWVTGDIYFADPTVTFNIENSFGIPTQSDVKIFKVLTVRGETLNLESPYVESGIAFPYPSISEVGEVKEEQFVFNKDNSNIDVILGAGPVAIDYDVDAVTNPDSNVNIRGFLTDSSYYKVRVDVDLPLYGRSLNFLARDTFEIDFSNFQQMYKAEFKLVTVNSLPLDVSIQGYFIDQEGVVLDSLFQESMRVIEGAPVDSEGNASGVKEDITYIDYPEERFNKARTAETLAIVASFSTVNNGNISVKILESQAVRVKLGAIFGVRD
ncbi:MAG: hypothetical protein H6573_06850 [Lewinellaceae bacterium]|nr:hypothetical protein [Phaeodactylibacter sp.]MCB9347220.1 hypothetical protein [Lewinellaceae bacterium]